MEMSSWKPGKLDRSAKFYVAGHNGMVGAAVWRLLEKEGFTNLVGKKSSELDLRDRKAVFDFFAAQARFGSFPNGLIAAVAPTLFEELGMDVWSQASAGG